MKKTNGSQITPLMAAWLASHEGLVLEAYLDSVGVWTWGVGVTNASGHQVFPRYKDKPSSLQKALTIYQWLLETKYLPSVLAAFKGYDLSEAELAAALSFHYNTGAIQRASWVKHVKAGNMAKARRAIMNWRKPKEILGRRKKERDLFFKGVWTGGGKVTVYPVKKPSYVPDFSKGQSINVTKLLKGM